MNWLFKDLVNFDKDPDGGGGSGGESDPKPEKKSFTQAELDAMFSERAKRAEEKAIAEILAKTGVKTSDELVSLTAEAKKAQEAQMSELEKHKKAAVDAEAKAQAAEAEKVKALALATERLMRAAVMAEATARGFRPEAIEDVWLVVDRSKVTEKDGNFTGIKEAVESVAKSKPFWLGQAKSPIGTPQGKSSTTKPGQTSTNTEQRPMLRL